MPAAKSAKKQPRKQPDRKRNVPVLLYFYPDEKDALLAAAGRESLAVWARSVLLPAAERKNRNSENS